MARRRRRTPSQFSWDEKLGDYRDRTGRRVDPLWVHRALIRRQEEAASRMRTIGALLRDERITLATWQREMQQLVGDVHMFSAAAAIGGFEQMTQADYGRVGATVRAQLVYLRRFAKQIENGYPLDGRFFARIDLYGRAGITLYHRFQRDKKEALGFLAERNVLTEAEHCEGCLVESARQWVAIGTLRPIGTRDCLGRDKCYIEYSNDSSVLFDTRTVEEFAPDIPIPTLAPPPPPPPPTAGSGKTLTPEQLTARLADRELPATVSLLRQAIEAGKLLPPGHDRLPSHWTDHLTNEYGLTINQLHNLAVQHGVELFAPEAGFNLLVSGVRELEAKLAPELLSAKDFAGYSLEEIEQLIGGMPFEHSVALRDGVPVFYKSSGLEGTISYTEEEWETFKGLQFTHNHPSGVPLSPPDITMLARTGVSEIRAVGEGGWWYSMKLPVGRAPFTDDEAYMLNAEMNDILRGMVEQYQAATLFGRMTNEEANFEFFDRMAIALAERHGFIYTRPDMRNRPGYRADRVKLTAYPPPMERP